MIHEALTWEEVNALAPKDAAARFIARRAEGLTTSEEQMLAEWLAKDESHRQAFASAERAWQVFDEAGSDEILAAMRAHARTAGRHKPRTWQPMAAAAAVVVLMVGAWVLIRGWNTGGPDGGPLAEQTLASLQYSTARGEVKALELPDGTLMTLDADSTAAVRFSSEGRSVLLMRGRAYFEIHPDSKLPFAVSAADRNVVAIGTRFDVNLGQNSVTVTLLEGHVEVATLYRSAAPARLEPGQQYVVRDGRVSVRQVGAAAENVIAWRTGLIYFDDESLAEAAAVMNRYSSDQIVVADPSVAAMRVSGQFRAGDAQRFAATLAELHPLRAVRDGERIELLPR